MPKSAPSTKPKAKSVLTLKKKSAAKKVEETPGNVDYGLVAFSFQDVDYQIDIQKSKVYRRFIEVEKSRTNSIIMAYRSFAPRPRPTL